jgi:hypothetical protein
MGILRKHGSACLVDCVQMLLQTVADEGICGAVPAGDPVLRASSIVCLGRFCWMLKLGRSSTSSEAVG